MKKAWFQVLIGQKALPEAVDERTALIQFADAHHVLGQLADRYLETSTAKTKDVLENALLRTAFDRQMLEFEMDRLKRALAGVEIVPVLLKGAAYVASGSAAGKGRRVSDIDILVAEDELAQIEKMLLEADWEFDEATANDYDQQYYRKHMHELPPLRHSKRQTIMDVHHRLLPRTARIHVKTDIFLKHTQSVAENGLKAFDPIGLFLHSAVHAFADGSFDTPMRTMLELWLLLADITPEEDAAIIERAQEVGAIKPCLIALHILHTLTDNKRIAALVKKAPPCGHRIARWALLAKFYNPEGATLAKAALYIRSHYLRMPLWRLIGHLFVKFLKRFKKQEAPQDFPGF